MPPLRKPWLHCRYSNTFSFHWKFRLARGDHSLELVLQVKNVPSSCRLLQAGLGTEVLLVSVSPVNGLTGRKIVLPGR